MEKLNKMVEATETKELNEQEEILEKMKAVCASKGFHCWDNSIKIARAKKALFGIDEWQRCPCDAKDETRFCISNQCQKDIETDGHCHCNCYFKEERVKK